MTAAREAAAAARDEYRRLLYVAMTRAAERLVVCGTKGDNKIPDGCWYQLVEDALKPDCVRSRPTTATARCCAIARGEAWRRAGVAADADGAKSRCRPGSRATPSRECPACACYAVERRRRQTDRFAGAAAGVKAALLRGSLVHRLLQSLPDIPAERRAKAAADYLARAGKNATAERSGTSPSKSCSCSRIRASTSFTGPAAAPRCRSSAG